MSKDTKTITLNFEDGSSKTIEKGMCLEFHREDGEEQMTAHMVEFRPYDLIVAAVGLLEVIDKMGLSGKLDEYLGTLREPTA